ncbi:tripartite tricarboxylate transporter TctB family protein [Siminovitchia sp. 179-K 8D1 HS]|uniref:tripartite tricarboxylate transporter TctB family protein n=1 Tax=Siminovitchia sp. 179-K 8D1 HS TaxID=3142385 RepID=UPI0039A13918
MKKANLMFAIIMMIVGLIAIIFTKDFVNNMPTDLGPSYYPIIISIITIILSILLILKSLIEKGEESNFTVQGLLKIGVGVVAFSIYFYLMGKIGFIISTVLFMSLFMLTLGLRNWKTFVLVPIGSTVVIYYIFAVVLKIRLPEILF